VRPLHRAAIVLGLVAALLAVGTAGFHLIEHWPWFLSFYCTLMTVSTIGAEPVNQLSHAGRVFNIVLIFLGRAGATTVISPYSYAGQRMARVLTRPNVQRFIDLAMSSLNDGGLDLQIEEVQVADDSRISGARLGETEIRKRLGIIILAIRRKSGRLDFNPGPEDTISPGDYLIAMGDSQKLKELEVLAGIQ